MKISIFLLNMSVPQEMHNKALLSDKFSASLQICRRARRYGLNMTKLYFILISLLAMPLFANPIDQIEKELKGKVFEVVMIYEGQLDFKKSQLIICLNDRCKDIKRNNLEVCDKSCVLGHYLIENPERIGFKGWGRVFQARRFKRIETPEECSIRVCETNSFKVTFKEFDGNVDGTKSIQHFINFGRALGNR